MISKVSAALSAVLADMTMSHNFEAYNTVDRALDNVCKVVPGYILGEMDNTTHAAFIEAVISAAEALMYAESNGCND